MGRAVGFFFPFIFSLFFFFLCAVRQSLPPLRKTEVLLLVLIQFCSTVGLYSKKWGYGGGGGSVEPVAALMLLAGVRAVVTLSYDCGVVARRGGRIPATHVTAELLPREAPLTSQKK